MKNLFLIILIFAIVSCKKSKDEPRVCDCNNFPVLKDYGEKKGILNIISNSNAPTSYYIAQSKEVNSIERNLIVCADSLFLNQIKEQNIVDGVSVKVQCLLLTPTDGCWAGDLPSPLVKIKSIINIGN